MHFLLKHLIKPTLPKKVISNIIKQNCCTIGAVAHLPLDILSADELKMKKSVARLAKEEIAPYIKEMEANGTIKKEIVSKFFEYNLMGLEIPPEYKGAGLNFMCSIQVVEEISKIDPAVAVLVDIQNTLVNTVIMKLGTPEQKAKYLPRLATNACSSFALSETTSGSEAFSLKTTAKKDGDYFILNGSKMWISNSDVADIFLLMANAKPEAGYKGVTCFIVERDTPGFCVAKPENKLGICASGTCMIHFDNVKIHESQILGEFGHGYKYAAGFLNEGRIGMAAQMIGLAQGCFDATVPYTLERKQFGQPIFKFQGMQHQIAEVATQIEAARLLVYNSARLVEQKKDFVKQSAMAKYFAAEVAQNVTVKCIDWMGGVGFTKEFPQEKFYRDVKIGSIYEGTFNMQLNTIAKYIHNQYNK